MRKGLLIVVAAIAFSAGLSLPFILFAVPRSSGEQTAEGQPVIRGALGKIESAKSDLINFAQPDPKGHRVKAVDHLNQAMDELNKVLDADKH